jgi:hypothetical protein
MKARRHARKHPRPERKFIPARTMGTIRWDVAVANRQVKAAGKQDEQYVSLHAWGCCCCCFLIPVRRVPPPTPVRSVAAERECPLFGTRGTS